jgi:4-hydroxybenzoate polyprenyltransferase
MMWSFIILIPFAIIMGIIFKQTLSGDSEDIKRGIKNMVISMIILDSIFITGVAGLSFGLPTLLFLFPSILLSRKFYVS